MSRKTSRDIISPGASIGVLGGGQLGRMFAMAARRMGYLVHTFSPDTDTPAGQISDREITAPYDDLEAVRRFAQSVDVVTFEFENVPSATVATVAEIVPVRPGGHVLRIAQHRRREKTWLQQNGFPVTPFRAVASLADVEQGLQDLGLPCVLKTAGFGYDGKGQRKITDLAQAPDAYAALNGQEAVLEAFIAFECEVSVIAARGLDGATEHFGVIRNEHRHHILDCSLSPAGVPPEVAREAVAITSGVLEALDVVGVLCVEFFLTRAGKLLINELAPRPHNSGHFTLDACITSQFEQQLRAVCGLPLGAPEQLRPAAMVNLLGDLWADGAPRWHAACAFPSAKLHLYGKRAARPGRKMGHLTACAATAAEAAQIARAARRELCEKEMHHRGTQRHTEY